MEKAVFKTQIAVALLHSYYETNPCGCTYVRRSFRISDSGDIMYYQFLSTG